ncbi:cytochrome P450 [Xylaria bambusicola]|uniref:cytochrome P450 n=1 Tax=Xylaria bambusicola TaxID=326684 RepID=UPI002007CE00|nr:cytochrome P450 [Xylaria bambusicola]KAI0513256.1 cytochrome P450 [Xylaria bambusicola]
MQSIYNIYFHPLSNVPGPYAWSASRLPFVVSLLRGTIVHDIQRYHHAYGPVLRIAPNEVTFACADAWSDILQSRSEQFLKDPVCAIDTKTHARMRKSLAPAFTLRALRAQEPILHQYVNLLVDRLTQRARFGEYFNCLHNSQYHPWISLLFNSVKAASFVAAARFYPFVEFILLKLIPPSLRKMQKDHYQKIVDKIEQRLNFELERPDIMSYVIAEDGKKGFSRDEINATFMTLTTAGSETTATVLGATLNYLVSDPEKLKMLSDEVRQRFAAFEDITLGALPSLPYLNSVINEGLRLCPPIPWILPRKVPHPGAMVCGTWLPGGTPVSIQAYTLNRDPKCFYAATSFLPERWLPEETSNPTSLFYKDQRDAFQPFSVGPRSCLGQHLARAELRLVLAKLIYKFDFTAVKDKVVKWEQLRTFLLVEKKPIMVNMGLRRRVIGSVPEWIEG